MAEAGDDSRKTGVPGHAGRARAAAIRAVARETIEEAPARP